MVKREKFIKASSGRINCSAVLLRSCSSHYEISKIKQTLLVWILSHITVNNMSSPSIPEIGHRVVKPWSTWSRFQKLRTGIEA